MSLADVRARHMKASLARVLGPDEPIESVLAVSTFPPSLRVVFLFVFLLGGRYGIVAATDRRVLVVSTRSFSSDKFVAVAVREDFPRDTTVGPVTGRPGRITLGGKRYYVLGGTKKFVADMDRRTA